MKDVVTEAKAALASEDGHSMESKEIIRKLLSIVERLQNAGLVGFSADGKVVVEGDTLYWPDGSELTFSHVADTNGRRFRTMPKQGDVLGELVSANNAYSTRAAAEAAGGEA